MSSKWPFIIESILNMRILGPDIPNKSLRLFPSFLNRNNTLGMIL